MKICLMTKPFTSMLGAIIDPSITSQNEDAAKPKQDVFSSVRATRLT